jgi:phosphoglucosamine mutase
MGLELALQNLDIEFVRSNVGDRYVMQLLKDKGWQLGAENSGHVINLNHTSTGDGIIAALNVLTAVSKQQKSLFELRKGLTMLPQLLVNVRFSGDNDPLADAAVLSTVDEVNEVLAGRGRVLLRKSGTEPLIRVMVEGPDKDEVALLANKIADVVKLVK